MKLGQRPKRGFTLPTYEMFSVHTSPGRNLAPVMLDLCLRKTRSGKSHDNRDAVVFEKLRFQYVFRPNKLKSNVESLYRRNKENKKLRFPVFPV